MRVYQKEEFRSFRDRDSGAVFSDVAFRECYFQGCAVSITHNPELRSTVRNVRMIDCSHRGCSVYTAVFEDVLVDGLKTFGQLLQCWGAVFNRVVLRGKIDRLMTSALIGAIFVAPEEQAAFDRANAEYYRTVDWALDISEVECNDIDIRGVPARLIRRDPETQVVVRRNSALVGDWRDLPFNENLWPTALSVFLNQGEADTVLVAPKRHAKFKRYLEDLNLLRNAGIAEPD